MAKEKKIVVLAATSQYALEQKGADVDEICDTIAQAKKRAKYFLTEEFMNACETTTRLSYSQVLVNGECLYDFFGRDSESQSREEMRDERLHPGE